MKIAIINDQHLGARKASQIIMDNQQQFYEEIFFPYLDEHKIDTIIDLGDTFDNRKAIDLSVLEWANRVWFDEVHKRNIALVAITGNHTAYYKNTNRLNTLEVLYKNSKYDNLFLVNHPATYYTKDNVPIALLPWICQDNYEDSMRLLETTPAQIVLGHLEIQGFLMHGEHYAKHGLESSVFTKFDFVGSGHFHTPSKVGNIQYFGSPYQTSWSDYGVKKGFHILDTETREFTFVHNPLELFVRLEYYDFDMEAEDLDALDFTYLADCYIKLVIKNRTKPELYEAFYAKLEAANPAQISITDHTIIELGDGDTAIDQTQDTISILKQNIESLEIERKQNLLDYFVDIYRESSALE